MTFSIRGARGVLFFCLLFILSPAEASQAKKLFSFQHFTTKDGLSSEMVYAIAAQGDEPRLLLNRRQAQVLFNRRDNINLIVVSNQGDELGGVAHSQAVTAHLRGLLSDPKVTAQWYSFLARDPAVAQALRVAAEREKGNTQADLLALANGLQAGALSLETRSLLADTELASRVQSILTDMDWGSQPLRDRLAELFSDQSDLGVDDVKRDTLDESETAASAFTTIFIVAGLFGISAGLVLIFLIFVMLAAERKSEMGMARAVGAQRGHLVEMFVFEGTAYDLAAAAVGVALGVLTGLIIAVTLGRAFAGMGITILPYISVNSLLVSYSLAMRSSLPGLCRPSWPYANTLSRSQFHVWESS